MTKVVQADRKTKTCFEFFQGTAYLQVVQAQTKIGVS